MVAVEAVVEEEATSEEDVCVCVCVSGRVDGFVGVCVRERESA